MTHLSAVTGTAVRSPASAVSGGRLERGASGAAVIELQKFLKAAGLYSKTVGGQFGPATEAAVKAFQRSNGLKVDGWAGPQTMAKLHQQAANPTFDGWTGPQTPAPTPSTAPTTPTPSAPAGGVQAAIDFGMSHLGAPYVGGASPFRFGAPGNGRTYQMRGQNPYRSPAGVVGFDCSGFVVAMFRQAGVDLGASRLTSSSAMKASLPAVPKDQLQRGDLLVKNGHVVMFLGGEVLQSTPNGGVCVRDAGNFLHDPSYVGRRVPLPDAPGPVGVEPPAPSAASPTLQRGSSGPHVMDLQRALIARGFNPHGVDGSFGPKTEAALIAFQRSAGLAPNGVAGPETLTALRSPSPNVPPVAGPRPAGPGGALIPPNSKVLLVGDSHTRGQFGLSLERQLRGQGMSVSTYASGGRNARHWVDGHVSAGNGFRISSDSTGVNEGGTGSGRHRFEPLEEIIRRERPSVLVMADGTNMLNAGGSAAIASVKALAQQYGVKLIWVGPPEMRKFNTEERFYRALRANLGGSIPVIDSRPATAAAAAAGSGDGVHYFDSQSRMPATDWALAVARILTDS